MEIGLEILGERYYLWTGSWDIRLEIITYLGCTIASSSYRQGSKWECGNICIFVGFSLGYPLKNCQFYTSDNNSYIHSLTSRGFTATSLSIINRRDFSRFNLDILTYTWTRLGINWVHRRFHPISTVFHESYVQSRFDIIVYCKNRGQSISSYGRLVVVIVGCRRNCSIDYRFLIMSKAMRRNQPWL